jgi:hypothetical protein
MAAVMDRPFTAADSAALVATAKARPDYQQAFADEAAKRINDDERITILRRIYRELLIAGGWTVGDGTPAEPPPRAQEVWKRLKVSRQRTA